MNMMLLDPHVSWFARLLEKKLEETVPPSQMASALG
jgi:hypothetical protein